MNLILFDFPEDHNRLLPLTFTRPVSVLRTGIFRIFEKWELLLKQKAHFLTVDYLQPKYPLHIEEDNIVINSTILPDKGLTKQILRLQKGEFLDLANTPLALRISDEELMNFKKTYDFSVFKRINYKDKIGQIRFPYDIFIQNSNQITEDIHLLSDSISRKINDPHTIIYSPENVYIGQNVNAKSSIIDAEDGPVFIDHNVTIQPGCIITGPVAILEGSVISQGAKIRPNTTIGNGCKVGGEVSHTVFQGFSNKSHEGFLGSSVIGEWCNFGAGSNNSNLKNNYGFIKLWNYTEKSFIKTDLRYCGLIMGDHSKCGINTMFNTGTVTGICANIYGSGYMPKFIPSFSWGGERGFEVYQFEKAIETAKIVMSRRSVNFTEIDRAILKHVFEITSGYRLKEG